MSETVLSARAGRSQQIDNAVRLRAGARPASMKACRMTGRQPLWEPPVNIHDEVEVDALRRRPVVEPAEGSAIMEPGQYAPEPETDVRRRLVQVDMPLLRMLRARRLRKAGGIRSHPK